MHSYEKTDDYIPEINFDLGQYKLALQFLKSHLRLVLPLETFTKLLEIGHVIQGQGYSRGLPFQVHWFVVDGPRIGP